LSELPNCIKDLVEIAGYSLYGSLECLVHNFEPLVMANNIKNIATCSFTQVWILS
jgi:hypothetical protein